MAKGLTGAFSLLIAAQFQAIGLIGAAWWVGQWLNEHHPQTFSWYAVTFPVATIAVGQTFYVMIRHAMRKEPPAGAPSQERRP